MSKHTCKDCTERKVGCHSTCAKYVVKRVIQTYKNQRNAMNTNTALTQMDMNETLES